MRKNRIGSQKTEFSILAVDDDAIMTQTVEAYFGAAGYAVDTENDPVHAVERIRGGHYDILLLDFLMKPICGDEVVSRVRAFNSEIFIIMLTGHRSMAPPVKTMRELDIQGYYEKSDRFDQLELLIESCAKSIRQMRTIRSYRDGLSVILSEMAQLYSMESRDGLLTALLTTALSLSKSGDGFLYLESCDPAGRQQRYYKGAGAYSCSEEMGREYLPGMTDMGIRRQEGGFALPITDEKHLPVGLLFLKPETSSPTLEQLMVVYAQQASAVLNNSIMDERLRVKNEELRRAYGSLKDSYMEMVAAMRQVVDAKDIYTRGHSDRVSFYAVLIARQMGKDDACCERVKIAGLFHDIGKIGVSDEILTKPDKLTAEEYDKVKEHPSRGVEILTGISAFADIVPVIAAHHERLDGRGYPRGIGSDDIPEEARVIAVADAFDAMTSGRSYRADLSVKEAVEELKRGRGTQFDAKAVDAFLAAIEGVEDIRQQVAWTFSDKLHLGEEL